MLSGILNSDRAIEVNIRIIRIFVMLRETVLSKKDILLKLETIEKEFTQHGNRTKKNEEDIEIILTVLKKLLNPPHPPRNSIGFKP